MQLSTMQCAPLQIILIIILYIHVAILEVANTSNMHILTHAKEVCYPAGYCYVYVSYLCYELIQQLSMHNMIVSVHI